MPAFAWHGGTCAEPYKEVWSGSSEGDIRGAATSHLRRRSIRLLQHSLDEAGRSGADDVGQCLSGAG